MARRPLVLAYHGCDEGVAAKIFSGQDHLRQSERPYDWLGHGAYFWEDSPARALEWARERVPKPAVIGAVIDLGHCLNLMEAEALTEVEAAYLEYRTMCRTAGAQEAQNAGPEMKARYLDCAVMETLHQLRADKGRIAYNTVRGFFVEGRELYPGAGFRKHDHVQICVRTDTAIVGFFRPRGPVR